MSANGERSECCVDVRLPVNVDRLHDMYVATEYLQIFATRLKRKVENVIP